MGFLGLTRQPDYLSFKSNIRSVEGGGATSLLATDNRIQVFNLISNQICVLPTGANIFAGDKWIISKQDSAAKLTITCISAASSTSPYIPSSSTICYLDSKFAHVEFVALQNNPSTPDHWDMKFRYNERQYRMGGIFNGGNQSTLTLGLGYGLTGYDGFLAPYQLFDGTWKIKGNLYFTTSHAAVTYATFYINSVASLNTFMQCFTCHTDGGGSGYGSDGGVFYTTGTMFEVRSSNSAQSFYITMDIILNAKPNWVY
jgi:hypothetical protein